MSTLWTAEAVAGATQGTASTSFSASGVAFDSRDVEPGDLFIALTGAATDGHEYLADAFARGATGAVVSRPCPFPHVVVSDTTTALCALAVSARARTAAKVIGVTGSVGKTGTKEALAAVLARANRGGVHRSVKSYNNHTGVPLSLARMPSQTAFGIFEMGMNHSGELAALTRLVRPHVAVITTVAAVHLEYFNDVEGIADAKAEIFEGLQDGGTAVVPFDNPHRDRLIVAAKPHAANIITFGRGDGADVHLLHEIPVDDGTIMSVALPGAEVSFTLAQPGRHWASNALAILAAVQAVGGDLAAAGLALADLVPLAGRGAQHRIALGGGEALLIDESYNANPASMAATLAVLGDITANRRVAVLGAMGELGPTSDALHVDLAVPIIQAGVEFVLLVGPAIKPLAKVLEGKLKTVHVATAADALAVLQEQGAPGDAILIKGSNAVGLGKIVRALTDSHR